MCTCHGIELEKCKLLHVSAQRAAPVVQTGMAICHRVRRHAPLFERQEVIPLPARFTDACGNGLLHHFQFIDDVRRVHDLVDSI